MIKKMLSPAMLAMLGMMGGFAPNAPNTPNAEGAEPFVPAPRELTEQDKMYLAAAQAKRARKGAKRLAALARQQAVTEARRRAREQRA